MGKIQEGIEMLKAFGLPKQQQNDRASRTLCALADIKENTTWSSAKRRLIKIHDIIQFISKNYKFTYAENSRETIRRQTIHQFEQARIVDRNPDDPTRPTNSGKTVYAISEDALPVIRSYGTPAFENKVKQFILKHEKLQDRYEKRKKLHKIPVTIGKQEYFLSPGGHNRLQKEIMERFVPQFIKNSIVLYIGDTAKKHLTIDNENLLKLKIPVTEHDKLPDIVMYDESKNRLFLIEAVTSHGPVSPKRHIEFEKMLKGCPAEKIYISAFPDFKTFMKYAKDIAWETEVWLSSNPEHMIHYNGDKFIGSK